MPTVESEVPQAFVRFARKVSPKQYETAEASVSIPIPMLDPVTGSPRTQSDIEAKAHAAMQLAQAEVLQTLGLAPTVNAAGNVAEAAPAAADDGFAEAVNTARAAAAPGARPFPNACPDCGGAVRDYRERKASGEIKRTYPDWKCADKGCGKAGWLTPKGS
jgi:hypothetical protein